MLRAFAIFIITATVIIRISAGHDEAVQFDSNVGHITGTVLGVGANTAGKVADDVRNGRPVKLPEIDLGKSLQSKAADGVKHAAGTAAQSGAKTLVKKSYTDGRNIPTQFANIYKEAAKPKSCGAFLPGTPDFIKRLSAWPQKCTP